MDECTPMGIRPPAWKAGPSASGLDHLGHLALTDSFLWVTLPGGHSPDTMLSLVVICNSFEVLIQVMFFTFVYQEIKPISDRCRILVQRAYF